MRITCYCCELGRGLVNILTTPNFAKEYQTMRCFLLETLAKTLRGLLKIAALGIKYCSLFVAAKKQTLQPMCFVLHGF